MRTSDINSLNASIAKFISEASVSEKILSTEAPDIWAVLLKSMRTLADVATFLEMAKQQTAMSEVEETNKLRKLNDLEPLKGYKLDQILNKERNIDLDIFTEDENNECKK